MNLKTNLVLFAIFFCFITQHTVEKKILEKKLLRFVFAAVRASLLKSIILKSVKYILLFKKQSFKAW